MDDTERVGTLEKAKGGRKGGRVADVRKGRGVVDVVKRSGGVRCEVVSGIVLKGLCLTASRTRQPRVRPCLLVGKTVKFCRARLFKALAIVHVGGPLGEDVAGSSILGSTGDNLVLRSGYHGRQQVVGYHHSGLVVNVEAKIHVWEVLHKILHHACGRLLLPLLSVSN
jgi:hypothetical protein